MGYGDFYFLKKAHALYPRDTAAGWRAAGLDPRREPLSER